MKRTIIAILGAAVLLTGCGATTGTGTASSEPAAAESTEAVAEETPAEETPTPEESTPQGTVSQLNALGAAVSYLENQSFSEKGLFQQLTSDYGEGFSKKDAQWAIDNLGKVDWNAEAVEAAESYLEFQNFSCKGLVQQLSSDYGDQYTKKQAAYAAKKVGLC